MNFWWGLGIGLVAGACLGLFVLSLLMAAGRGDR